MPRKLATPTKGDKLALVQRVQTLFFAGNTLIDACTMAGADYQAIKKRAQREGWSGQIKESQQLAQKASPVVPGVGKIAYDQALTSKKTKKLLSKSSKNVAKWIYEQSKCPQGVEVLFEHASSFKAHVESGDKLFKWNEEVAGNRFAVAIQVNGIDAGIRKVPQGVTVEESNS